MAMFGFYLGDDDHLHHSLYPGFDEDDFYGYDYLNDTTPDYDSYGSGTDDEDCLFDSEKPTIPVPSGFSYDFTSSPPEDLTCPICLSVLRDANLISCCGNHFCEACIALVKSSRKPCPLCKEKKFTLMLDKKVCRKVKQLEVKCPHSSQGCEWVGELSVVEKHITDIQCDFVEVLCDLNCGEKMTQRDLSEHKSKACKERQFICEHCQLQDTWSIITQDHYPVCDKYPTPCPNQCDVGEIERKELVQHILVCPLQVINCTFQFAGCKVSLPRRDMQQHVSDNMASHLTLGFQTFQQQLSAKDNEIAKLKETVASLKTELDSVPRKKTVEGTGESDDVETDICMLHEEVDELREEIEAVREITCMGPSPNEDHRTYPPFHVTMTNCEQLRSSNAQWFSEPFYTHPRGYKLCLSVFPNGTGIGSGTHISVFANIMRGEFDSSLCWPFRGLLNVNLKLESGSQYVVKLQFTDRSPVKAAGRVESGDRKTFGQGASLFVPQCALSGGDKKYLDFEVMDVHVSV